MSHTWLSYCYPRRSEWSQVITRMSHVTKMNMLHMWMSHVTHMNETHMNESCHTYEWSHVLIVMSHVTHMNESCHTYEWSQILVVVLVNLNGVMSRIWISYATSPMNESRHTLEWVTYLLLSWSIWPSVSCAVSHDTWYTPHTATQDTVSCSVVRCVPWQLLNTRPSHTRHRQL